MSVSESLAVCVVGCGYWGPNLARNFSHIPGCRLAAVCDVDPVRLEAMESLYPSVPKYRDAEEMLAREKPDAVVVATPLRQHFKLAKAALLAGAHVLVEKPLASSSAECEELIFLAASRGLTLMVGHTFLYSAPVEMIKTLVVSGDLGEIRYINSQRLNLGIFQKDINVVWDLAPHDLSIILHVLESMPESVNCRGKANVTPGVEDVANLSLTFGSGKFATIQSSWLEPRKVRQMTIVGSRRMVIYDDIEPTEKIRIYDSRVETPPHYDNFGEFQYSYHYGDSYIPRIEQGEPLGRMCRHFVDSVISGSKPLTCGERGMDVVRVLEACTRSLNANGGAKRVDYPKVGGIKVQAVPGFETHGSEFPNIF